MIKAIVIGAFLALSHVFVITECEHRADFTGHFEVVQVGAFLNGDHSDVVRINEDPEDLSEGDVIVFTDGNYRYIGYLY